MRIALLTAVVLVATDPCPAQEAPTATGALEGKRVRFPEKGIAGGTKAIVGLLESCHDESLYTAAERMKAEQGDHIRLTFPKPVTVTVLGKRVEASEVVLRLPLGTGVFWVRSGETWRRYAKFEFIKHEPLETWLREARPAD